MKDIFYERLFPLDKKKSARERMIYSSKRYSPITPLKTRMIFIIERIKRTKPETTVSDEFFKNPPINNNNPAIKKRSEK